MAHLKTQPLELLCALCGNKVFKVKFARVETASGFYYAFICDECDAPHRMSTLLTTPTIRS